MGTDCCGAKEEALRQLRERQALILKIVLFINGSMFLIEFGAGIIARSSALLADSLDMFGDTIVYGFSLFVLYKSERWRASAALLKGLIMFAFGLGVLGEVFAKAMMEVQPDASMIGLIGTFALLANVICLFLLMKHKDDDINMKSTWICSRNDLIANGSVLISAAAVGIIQNKWPDLIVGALISIVFIKSAVSVIAASLQELKIIKSAS